MKKKKTQINYLCLKCWTLIGKPKRHYNVVPDGTYTTVRYKNVSTTTQGEMKEYTGLLYCPTCKFVANPNFFKKAILPKGERKRIQKELNQTADMKKGDFASVNIREKWNILINNGVEMEYPSNVLIKNTPTPESSSPRFCPNCGRETDTKFCPDCGSEISNIRI